MGTAGDHGVHGALRYRPVPELVALDLPGGTGFVDALRAIWDTGDAAAPLDPRLPPAAGTTMLDASAPPASWDPTASSILGRRAPGRGGRRTRRGHERFLG
jgi:hypothetical protein